LKHILDFLESFVIIVLVLAGLVGLSYRMFRGGGWFESALERAAELVFQNVTVSIVVAIASAGDRMSRTSTPRISERPWRKRRARS